MARIKKVKGIGLPRDYRLNGKKYQFKWRRMKDKLGLCSSPEENSEGRIIWINPDSDAETIVKTLIHEMLHAQIWVLDEDTVERTSQEMFEVLKIAGAIKLE